MSVVSVPLGSHTFTKCVRHGTKMWLLILFPVSVVDTHETRAVARYTYLFIFIK